MLQTLVEQVLIHFSIKQSQPGTQTRTEAERATASDLLF